MSEIIDTGIQCLSDEAQAILDLIPRMGTEFEQSVDLILNCRGKVIVTGVGKSGHVGSKIAATLASTGTPSFYLNPLLSGYSTQVISSTTTMISTSICSRRFMPILSTPN